MEGEMQVISKSAKERYTLGVVYEPDVVDAQGDFAKSEDIQKACWDFMRRLQRKDVHKAAQDLVKAAVQALETGETVRLSLDEVLSKAGLNDMHVNTPWDDNLGDIVECYTCPVDTEIGGQPVKKGTWLMGVVWSPEAFAKIEAGQRIGFSMEGRAVREEVK